jgi:uncharacterized membrane protein
MVENPNIRISYARQRRSRSMSRLRLGGLAGGSALAVYGIARRSKLGIALAAAGGTLAFLSGIRRGSPEAAASATILVNCKREDAYQFWRDFGNLPLFMNRLENVSVVDERHSRWEAVGPGGRPICWDAEITDERAGEYIAWQSLPDSDVQVSGRVEFREAPAGRGTLIRACIEYSPIDGAGYSFAKFLNKGLNFAMRQDLRRLEALMEAGEIPTIEGQSHGRRDVITGALRAADPTRPARRGVSLRKAVAARRRIA